MTWDVTRFVSYDLETHKIEPGLLAPPIVIGSYMKYGGAPQLLYPRAGALCYGQAILESQKIMVGTNIAFDLCCLAVAGVPIASIFRALDEGRVFDVQIAQTLDAIYRGELYLDPVTKMPMRGRYSLEECVRQVLGRDDAKINDEWKERYAELEGLPLEQWAPEARQYPLDDAQNTLQVAIAQVTGAGRGPTPGPHQNLGDLAKQVDTAFCMRLGAIWGLPTDFERTREVRAAAEAAQAKYLERFQGIGFYRPDGTRDTAAVKRAIVIAYSRGEAPVCEVCAGKGKMPSAKTGKPINCPGCSGTGLYPGAAPKTEKDGISTSEDTLLESGDDLLEEFGSAESRKTLSTYIPALEREIGKDLSPNVMVASGRSSYGVIHQLPREGPLRSCLRAREGRRIISVDYSGIELVCLAQINYMLFGRSNMMEVINAGADLHTTFAAVLAGKPPEEMAALKAAGDLHTKRMRDVAKSCNFALAGGMGAEKFVLTARKVVRFCTVLAGMERCGVHGKTIDRYGRPLCSVCLELAHDVLKPKWLDTWSEMPWFFGWCSRKVDAGGSLKCWGADRVRGGMTFPELANANFQSMAADGMKSAFRGITRECYLVQDSPLVDTHPIAPIHDEVIAEAPEATAEAAKDRIGELMISHMRVFTPNVTVRVEGKVMTNWEKG